MNQATQEVGKILSEIGGYTPKSPRAPKDSTQINQKISGDIDDINAQLMQATGYCWSK